MKIEPKLNTWHIILNPNALLYRSCQFWTDIETKLQGVQIEYICHVTFTVEEAKGLIASLCKKGMRHFIIVGGDGSLNIFVNAIMESKVKSSEVYAAFFPLGTGNDWGRSLGYTNSYIDAIDALINGNFVNHDIGLVETIVNDKVVDARYFVNIAGFGFDGAVIANASRKKSRKFLNKQMYLINLLKTLFAHKSQMITIKSNEFTAAKNIFTIAVGIGQYNGNGMRQCPEAIINDGLFDVVLIEKLSALRVLLNIKNLFKGAHIKNLKEASMIRTNYLEINAEPFILGEVEGEVLTTGNYRISCFESAINFLQCNNN